MEMFSIIFFFLAKCYYLFFSEHLTNSNKGMLGLLSKANGPGFDFHLLPSRKLKNRE